MFLVAKFVVRETGKVIKFQKCKVECRRSARQGELVFFYRQVVFVGQKARHIDPMSAQCWASVADGAPTLIKHWGNVLLLAKFVCRFRCQPVHKLRWMGPGNHQRTWNAQCWRNVGPASQTVAQHYASIGSLSRVCQGAVINHQGVTTGRERSVSGQYLEWIMPLNQ